MQNRDYKYSPIIKTKGFDPSPVARGIPFFADSIANPKCVGSKNWEDWWLDQFDRCLNGYKTGGLHIPGRLYYFLNFAFVTTVKRGRHYPEFVDIDYEFAVFVEELKKDHMGGIYTKARRRGLSEKTSKMIVDYGYRFSADSYKAGVGAGLEKYSTANYKKCKELDSWLPPEMRLHRLTDNSERLVLGWVQEEEDGTSHVSGCLSEVHCQTMKNNPNVFKGEFFEDVIFEESGENPYLLDGYDATKDCFMIGDKMVGTPHIFGTGGNIKNESKGFKYMYYNQDEFDLRAFDIYADRLHNRFFIGCKDENGKVNDEAAVNIHKLKEENNLDDEQVIGCEDVPAARTSIYERRKKLAKAKDKKRYYDFLQNNPLNAKEAFKNYSHNYFNSEVMNEQMLRIDEKKGPVIARYRLVWKTDSKGQIIVPFQVRPEAVPNEYDGHDVIDVLQLPKPDHPGLDIAGLDSYDLDQSKTSPSLGAMLVFRRSNNIPNAISNAPIALIRARPPRKEQFYELCLKTAIWYNILSGVMIDYSKPLVIDYFQKNGGVRFLAKRPKAIESEGSTLQHDYGASMNRNTKPKMLGLIQSWHYDNLKNCWFEKVVEGMQSYDIEQDDSDWDEVDALGLALIKELDIRIPYSGDTTQKWEDAYDIGSDAESSLNLEGLNDPLARAIYAEQNQYGDDLSQPFS